MPSTSDKPPTDYLHLLEEISHPPSGGNLDTLSEWQRNGADKILKAACAYTDADVGGFLIVDQDKRDNANESDEPVLYLERWADTDRDKVRIIYTRKEGYVYEAWKKYRDEDDIAPQKIPDVHNSTLPGRYVSPESDFATGEIHHTSDRLISEWIIPLIFDGELLGFLNLESGKKNHFAPHSNEWARNFARMTSFFIQNSRQRIQSLMNKEVNEALNDIHKQIIDFKPENRFRQLMLPLLESMMDLLGGLRGQFFFYDHQTRTESKYVIWRFNGKTLYEEPDTRNLDIAPHTTRFSQNEQFPPTTNGRGIVPHVAKTKEPYRTRVAAPDDPHYVAGTIPEDIVGLPDDRTIKSEMAYPLLEDKSAADSQHTSGDEEELLGILNIESHVAYAYKQYAEDYLELFARQALVAVMSARDKRNSYRTKKRQQVLDEVSAALSKYNPDDKDGIYAGIYEKAEEAFPKLYKGIIPYDSDINVAVWVYDTIQDNLNLQYKSFMSDILQPGNTLQIGQSLTGHAAETQTTVRVNDISYQDQQRPWDAIEGEPEQASMMAIPLIYEERTKNDEKKTTLFGVVTLYSEENHVFADDDGKTMCELLARQISLHLEQVRVLSHRQNQVLADHFKSYNLNLAHQMNNRIGLAKVAVDFVASGVQELNRELSIDTREPIIYQEIDEQLKATQDHIIEISHVLDRYLRIFRTGGDVKLTEMTPDGLKLAIEDVVYRAIDEMNQIAFEPEFYINPQELPAILCEDDLLRMALFDIVNNALQAMENQPDPRLIIHVQQEHNRVALTIEDNGQGIPFKHQTEIFGMRFTTKKDGSGIGLPAARNNVEVCGGELHLDWSEKDVGTRFKIQLPVYDNQTTN